MYRDFNASGSGPDLRMGLVKFSSSALTETDLTSNFSQLVEDIEKTQYAQGATYTREAYNEAKNLLNRGSRGNDYRKIIIFITDGMTSVGVAPDKAFADSFHNEGIEVVAVGVKGYVKSELMIMANQEERNVIEV